MDLSLTWEQQQLKDTLERAAAARKGDWRASWQGLAELGVAGLTVAADAGGAGAGGTEAMIAAEALGRANRAAPFIDGTVLAAGLLDEAGSPAQRDAHLPAVAAGAKLLAFAHGERAARFDPAHVGVRATKRDAGFALLGQKAVVPWADAADLLIVSARIKGEATDRRGAALFLVEPATKGVTVRGYPTVDGHRAADVTFESALVPAAAMLPEPDQAVPRIVRALDRAAAAAVAEAAGAMAALHEMTLAYAKQRRQFGQTIGSFQAVQHRLVEMFMAVEGARSMAALAAIAADSADAAARARDVSAAKAHAGQWGRYVAQQAVQLHGAIAMTDEYPAGRYFKRLTALELLYGDADWHRRRFAALSGD